ncbi:MAG: competence/damage-inducible protein A [Acidimicrobiales bacterium]
MRCDVVAVGTELLLGQIVDTNSAWLGEQLALAGIDSLRQVKVGDNHGRIVTELRSALDAADAVIVCGGLGPTQDDITRDAIAAVMGVELELDDDLAARIEAMFTSRGRRMPANNLRQAEVPTGATAIADPQPGTAPGLLCPVPWPDGRGGTVDKVLYAVPGVPHELRQIVTRAVLPDLLRRAGERTTIRSRTLRTWGESESGLAERLAARITELDRTGACTIAFLASGVEGLKVRLTVKAGDEAAANAVLDVEEAELRAILGDIVFGLDDVTMETAVARLLEARGLTLAVAESVTGGMIAARLTDVAGVSAVLRGGVVAYSSEVKTAVLGVPAGPVITEAAARAMADGVRRALGADVGLATTGVAGPDEAEGRPAGTVIVGLALGEVVEAVELRLPGNRRGVRELGTISALDLLRRRLTG